MNGVSNYLCKYLISGNVKHINVADWDGGGALGQREGTDDQQRDDDQLGHGVLRRIHKTHKRPIHLYHVATAHAKRFCLPGLGNWHRPSEHESAKMSRLTRTGRAFNSGGCLMPRRSLGSPSSLLHSYPPFLLFSCVSNSQRRPSTAISVGHIYFSRSISQSHCLPNTSAERSVVKHDQSVGNSTSCTRRGRTRNVLLAILAKSTRVNRNLTSFTQKQ
jgi:hypothetical protein